MGSQLFSILNFRGCIHIKNASVAKARHQQLQPDVVAATASMDAVVSQAVGKNWAQYCWVDFLIPVVKLWEEDDRFVSKWFSQVVATQVFLLNIFAEKIGEDEPIFDSQILKTWVGSTTN